MAGNMARTNIPIYAKLTAPIQNFNLLDMISNLLVTSSDWHYFILSGNRLLDDFYCVAAGLGLEPRLAGPKPAVLPLDDPAMFSYLSSRLKVRLLQVLTEAVVLENTS